MTQLWACPTCSYTLSRGEDGRYELRSVLMRGTAGLVGCVGAADEA